MCSTLSTVGLIEITTYHYGRSAFCSSNVSTLGGLNNAAER